MTTSEQQIRFEEKIQELRANQGKNVKMFSNKEYHDYIQKLKDIKSPGHRMVPSDFYLMKRFEILQVEKNGILVEKLAKPGTRLRYVTFENVFEAIREAHEEGTKHGCRDILSKKIQQYYANITVKQLHAFVDCCEICKFKKGRMISTGGVRLTA